MGSDESGGAGDDGAHGSGALQETTEDGKPHDLQVECHRPVLDVVEVVLNSLLERRVTAPAVYLRPARDARLHLVPKHVLRDAVLELFDEERTLRARTDNGHVAAEHIPQLRELVEVELAQPSANR